MSQAGMWLPGGNYLATLTGNSGGAVGPDSAANINIIGAGGVTVTGDGSDNTLTITGGGGSGGLTWAVVTGSTQSMSSNHGYIVNYSGTCVLSLPSLSSVGDIITITGINNNTGWMIAQATGQNIFFSTINTTSGSSGYLESTYITDTVTMVCTAANTKWQVISSVGNITYN
jgi:hypothetical protein